MGDKPIMSKKVAKEYGFNKYFFWGAVGVLVVLSYLILRPYFIALISAFILAYLVRPIHLRLSKKMSVRIAALLTILLVLIVIIVPIAVIIGGITQQAYKFLAQGGLEDVITNVALSPTVKGVDLDLLNQLSSFVISYFTDIVLSVPSFLVSLFIVLFGMYYILVDWEILAADLKKYIPFKEKEGMIRDISKVTNILVYGTFLMALLEFVIAAAGFYILGVKFYLLLAVVVFFFAFIPAIGPAIVWIPLLIYYIVVGEYGTAVGILVIGVILSVVVDAILRVKVLGKRSNINPLVMILGILGGISVFGVFGFIIGPLVLAYTLEIIQEIARRH